MAQYYGTRCVPSENIALVSDIHVSIERGFLLLHELGEGPVVPYQNAGAALRSVLHPCMVISSPNWLKISQVCRAHEVDQLPGGGCHCRPALAIPVDVADPFVKQHLLCPHEKRRQAVWIRQHALLLQPQELPPSTTKRLCECHGVARPSKHCMGDAAGRVLVGPKIGTR
eukprot:CAMPEP_0119544586 /NCGR_PEP_ID=MMETSP1344-20130328/54806_1 /TAXON_ID=236787 /ORGANISM="Florenciella parvula, Strain CCMP2471" /LENGTH=169 /DNA_ID=CAMNT_0007589089 /DNA_START=634 /DNA_END=1143 /DNA_ORIENTATION=+